MTPYVEMAKSIGFEHSERVAKLFSMIADPDEATVILAASPPATAEELAEKTGFEVERMQEMLDTLFVKGLIYKSKKPDAIRYYKFRNFIQFHDGTVLTPGISREYLDLWKEFEDQELAPLRDAVKETEQDRFMRVVPINLTVESQKAVSAPDDVVKMVNEAEKIAVTNCSCRVIHPQPEVPLEVCMQLNKAAYYALERGTGRELTKQEAIDMLKMCEDEGLVHCVNNTRDLGYLICNCDGVACENWAPDKPFSKNFTAPSRFKAVVDMDACTACESCIDRCFFEAVIMDESTNTAMVNPDNCMGCGVCIPTCEGDAIVLKEVAPLDSIPG